MAATTGITATVIITDITTAHRHYGHHRHYHRHYASLTTIIVGTTDRLATFARGLRLCLDCTDEAARRICRDLPERLLARRQPGGGSGHDRADLRPPAPARGQLRRARRPAGAADRAAGDVIAFRMARREVRPRARCPASLGRTDRRLPVRAPLVTGSSALAALRCNLIAIYWRFWSISARAAVCVNSKNRFGRRFLLVSAEGTRTLDPMIKSHVLYRLSYALTLLVRGPFQKPARQFPGSCSAALCRGQGPPGQ